MTKNMKWMLTIVGLLVLLLVIFVPLAFLYGRYIFEDSVAQVTPVPTQTGIVILPTSTQVPDIVIPQSTPTALPTSTLLPTSTSLPTNTPLPTLTPLPTNTPLPVFTSTPVPPAATSTPTKPCNGAEFVADITVPDGSVFAPGTPFTKTWRLKNVGTCTWNTEYSLNFTTGTAMTEKNTVVYLKQLVRPGETVDVDVKLVAPSKPNAYVGNWLMKNPAGETFGAGEKFNAPVDVQIVVLKIDPNASFDFVLKICDAKWRNNAGDLLACPSSPTGKNGFATVVGNPKLEERQEDEPALWVNPNHASDGKIRGVYPVYKVKAGDHFKAWIGCFSGNDGCNVTFELAYMKDGGPVTTLQTWSEKADGSSQILDVDLSFLADSNVNFILMVRPANNKFDKANAYWFVPRIVNVSP